MEAFDLPVGLWSVGPGPFVGDAECGAGVAPGERAVAGAVVGKDAFDVTPRSANQSRRGARTPIAVSAFSSAQISA